MRAGFTSALEQRVRRADPTARLYIHARSLSAGAIKRTKDAWSAADSTTGLDINYDGVRISGSLASLLASTVSDGFLAAVGLTSPWHVAQITWGGTEPADLEVSQVTAYLDPANGGAKEVVTWQVRLYAVLPGQSPKPSTSGLELQPLCDWVQAAAGASAGDVTFDLSKALPRPLCSTPPGSGLTYPTTVIVIQGLKADGSPAAHVAWATDSTTSANGVTSGGKTLKGRRYTLGADGTFTDTGAIGGTPRCAIKLNGSLTAKTIAFTGGGNQVDLGSVPSSAAAVEFTVTGEVPVGCSLTGQARVLGTDPWVTFLDGQTAAAIGLAASQTYQVRCTLTPDSTNQITPMMTDLGASVVTVTDLSDVATVSGGGNGYDAVNFAGIVPELRVVAIKDGEADFRDAITTLLSTTDIGNLWVRVYLGAGDLTRDQWMVLDDYTVDDVAGEAGAMVLTCVGVLAKLRGARVPPYNSGTNTRTALAYANVTLKYAYNDLIANQAALAARHIGAMVEDGTTQVTKTITDSLALDELGAIAYLAGGAVVGSQGKVKFVDVLSAAKGAVGVWPFEECHYDLVSPGWRQRVPEFYVDFGWNNDQGTYKGQVRGINGTALTKLGVALVDEPDRLDDVIARWIPSDGGVPPTSALANTVANRVVQRIGTGLITLQLRTTYAYPEVEPGDLVVLRTDRLAVKSPLDGRAIAGYTWVAAVVTEVQDLIGTQFTVMVRSYSDILGSSSSVDVSGLPVPVLYSSYSGTLGSGTVDYYTFGRTGAPAASNPYYGFRLDASTPPVASMVSYDGTTTRTYWTANHSTGVFNFPNGVSATTVNGTVIAGSTRLIAGASSMGTQARVASLRGASGYEYEAWYDATPTRAFAQSFADNATWRWSYFNGASWIDSIVTIASSGAVSMGALTATTGAFTGKITVTGDEFRSLANTVDLRIGAESFAVAQGAIGTISNHPVDVYTNGVRRLSVAATGAADFQGNAVSMGALTATSVLVTGGGEVVVRSTGGKDWSIQGDATRLLFNETGVANRMQMTATAFSPASAGGLTLGTGGGAAPWDSLHVGSATVYGYIAQSGGSIWELGSVTNHDVSFFRGNAQKMVLESGQLRTLSGVDLTIGSLGRFDSTTSPTGSEPSGTWGRVLSYNITNAKWQPRTIQLSFNSGVMTTGNVGDTAGTFFTSANDGRTLNGTAVTPSAPTVTAGYGSLIVDMGAAPPTGVQYELVYQYSTNNGSTWSGDVTFCSITAQAVVHTIFQSNGTLPTTFYSGGLYSSSVLFRYAVREHGSATSSYSSYTSGLAPSNKTEVNPFALVAASQIACVNLSAIVADLGKVGAGIVQNSLSSPTNAIRLSSAYTLPGGLNVYWDMPNKVLVVNDGTRDRVTTGLISGNYGFQIRDSSGNLSLDAARSDGRLYLQIGKSASQAPAPLLIFQASALSTTSTTDVSLTSYSLPASALGTDGDLLRITVIGSYTATDGGIGNVLIKFGATTLVTAGFATVVKFFLTAYVVRTGAATQHYTTQRNFESGNSLGAGTAAETLSGAVTVDVRGKVNTGQTLSVDHVSIEYLGTP